MAYCISCGIEAVVGAKFCHACGSLVHQTPESSPIIESDSSLAGEEEPKVRSESDLLIWALSQIGNNKSSVPMEVRGWSNVFGLYVQVDEFGTSKQTIKAGGKWQSSLEAERRLEKKDEDALLVVQSLSGNGLNFANGVAVDTSGNVYVAGGISRNVFKIAAPGTCSTGGQPLYDHGDHRHHGRRERQRV